MINIRNFSKLSETFEGNIDDDIKPVVLDKDGSIEDTINTTNTEINDLVTKTIVSNNDATADAINAAIADPSEDGIEKIMESFLGGLKEKITAVFDAIVKFIKGIIDKFKEFLNLWSRDSKKFIEQYDEAINKAKKDGKSPDYTVSIKSYDRSLFVNNNNILEGNLKTPLTDILNFVREISKENIKRSLDMIKIGIGRYEEGVFLNKSQILFDFLTKFNTLQIDKEIVDSAEKYVRGYESGIKELPNTLKEIISHFDEMKKKALNFIEDNKDEDDINKTKELANEYILNIEKLSKLVNKNSSLISKISKNTLYVCMNILKKHAQSWKK